MLRIKGSAKNPLPRKAPNRYQQPQRTNRSNINRQTEKRKLNENWNTEFEKLVKSLILPKIATENRFYT